MCWISFCKSHGRRQAKTITEIFEFPSKSRKSRSQNLQWGRARTRVLLVPKHALHFHGFSFAPQQQRIVVNQSVITVCIARQTCFPGRQHRSHPQSLVQPIPSLECQKIGDSAVWIQCIDQNELVQAKRQTLSEHSKIQTYSDKRMSSRTVSGVSGSFLLNRCRNRGMVAKQFGENGAFTGRWDLGSKSYPMWDSSYTDFQTLR